MAHVIFDQYQNIVQLLLRPTRETTWIDDRDPRLIQFINMCVPYQNTRTSPVVAELITILLQKRLCLWTDFSSIAQQELALNLSMNETNIVLDEEVAGQVMHDIPIARENTIEQAIPSFIEKTNAPLMQDR